MKTKSIAAQTVISWVIILLCTGTIQSTIINIPIDQPTIQAGIDIASTGDTILVQPGRYLENINFNGKNIHVSSLFLLQKDTTLISRTIIDGNQVASVITFENNEDTTAVLTGFSITNGIGINKYDSYWGGGIFCNQASPKLDNLKIYGDTVATGQGGGIYFRNSRAILLNSEIFSNSAYYGGAIRSDYSNIRLENVIVKNNFAISGIIMFVDSFKPVLTKLIITGNHAVYGGGVNCVVTSPYLENVTFWGNSAVYGGALNIGYDSHPIIINSILWNNSLNPNTTGNEIWLDSGSNSITIAYSDVDGGLDSIKNNDKATVNWLSGNINLNPSFIDPVGFDFHLQDDSPCIDAGTAFFIWQNDTLLNLHPGQYIGAAPDQGALEYGKINSIEITETGARQFVLYPNYPNPFNATTTISYSIAATNHVSLKIYDLLGKEICILTDQIQKPGRYTINFNATTVSSGIYFCRLQVGADVIETQKMLLIR